VPIPKVRTHFCLDFSRLGELTDNALMRYLIGVYVMNILKKPGFFSLMIPKRLIVGEEIIIDFVYTLRLGISPRNDFGRSMSEVRNLYF